MISTPETLKPIASLERVAVLRSSGVSLTETAVPPRWEIRAEFAALRFAHHAGNHFAANHETTYIGAIRLFDELLHKKVFIKITESVDHALRSLLGFSKDNTFALRALKELDYERCPTHKFDQFRGHFGGMRETAHGHSYNPCAQAIAGARSLSRDRDIATDSFKQ
jgi:hypothetical protein